MHYIESGDGDPVLFLHGNPTSSYLWRNIIPHVQDCGRCIALDLIGMGRSDKPNLQYRFVDHARYVEGFIRVMNLANITLVLHDWGSALGFHYAMRHEGNVKGLAFMEAIIEPASWSRFPKEFRVPFKLFRAPVVGWLIISVLNAFVERILPQSIVRPLTKEEHDAYRAPFPTVGSRKPVRRWPQEIPIDGAPADVHEIVAGYNRKLQSSGLPKLLFHASPGAILGKRQVQWCSKNLQSLTVVDLGKGLHFLQEDHPHRIGREVAAWLTGIQ
jgi:haloalkane dehalogenase